MAQKRMLDKKISVSEQVANLGIEGALFFTWMVPHADDLGLLPYSARTLKALVVPMFDIYTVESIGNHLETMRIQNLIEEFNHDGETFWKLTGFTKTQTLKRDRQPQTLLKIELSKKPKDSWIKVLENIGIQMDPNGIQLDTEEKRREVKRKEVKISEAKLKEEKEYEREKPNITPPSSGSDAKALFFKKTHELKGLSAFVMAAFLLGFVVTPAHAKTFVTRTTIKSVQATAQATQNKVPSTKTTPTGKSLATQIGHSKDSTYTVQPKQIASGGDIKKRIREVFPEEPDRAVAIARCESGLRTNATGYNTNGSIDQGAMQINSIHQAKYAGRDIYDLETNLQVARQIYDRQGWGPWSCSRRV